MENLKKVPFWVYILLIVVLVAALFRWIESTQVISPVLEGYQGGVNLTQTPEQIQASEELQWVEGYGKDRR